MKLSGVLSRRVRGFRVLDLAALGLTLALALTVYAFKTSAGAQRTDIADVEDQIHDETRQVRLLRAEVAGLESPARVERLAKNYAEQRPVAAGQEIEPGDLARLNQPSPAASNAATLGAQP